MHDFTKYEAVVMLRLNNDEREMLSSIAAALESGFSAPDSVDTDGVEPLVTVLCLSNVLREDVAGKLMTRDEILLNAPEQYDGFFQVPGTLG